MLEIQNSITSSPTAFNGSVIIVSLSCAKQRTFHTAKRYATERSRGLKKRKTKELFATKLANSSLKILLYFRVHLTGSQPLSYRLLLLLMLPTISGKSMTFHQTSVMPVCHWVQKLSCPIPTVKAKTAWT